LLCGAQEDPVFAELVENVIVAIKYFNRRVEKAREAGGWDWSVEKVLEVIKGVHAHICALHAPLHVFIILLWAKCK